MSRAKMTLLGFYDYLDSVSVDLFAAFDDLPEGIDKDTLVSNIMLTGGEFEVTYADPYFLKAAIEPWVSKWGRTFEKWVEALALEYDPISNYDRHEEWTDKHTGTVTDDGKGSHHIDDETEHTRDLTSETGGSSKTKTTGKHDGWTKDTTETKVSAYDTADYANRDYVEGNGKDHSDDETKTEGESGSKTHDTGGSTDKNKNDGWTKSDNTRTNDLTDVRTGRAWGNIGVTTSVQMLKEHMDFVEWNLYEHITDLFLSEFTIMIYE